MRCCGLIVLSGLAILIPALSATAPPESPTQAPKAKGLSWSYKRDQSGRLIEATDPAGRTTTIAYKDGENRTQQITRTAPDGSVVVTAFRGRRRIQLADALGKTQYSYDARGRLQKVAREGGSTIAYAHDEADRLTSVTVDGKWTTRYHYDFLGRVGRIDSPAGRIDIRATPNAVELTLPNGVRSVRKTNPDGTLASITHTDKDGKELAKFAYAYRPDRLVREVTESGPQGARTVTYSYDAGLRLVAVSDSRGKTTFRYDRTGNRLSVTGPDGKAEASKFDWDDRMTATGGADVQNDAVGNVTEYTGTRGKVTAKYSANGQLASLRTKAGEITYAHDGDGRLVSRTAAGKKTTYLADPLAGVWRPMLETDADGKKTFYLWVGDVALAAVSDGGVRFFLGDHLGSARALADATGRVTDRFDFGPFGEVPGWPAGAPRPGFAGLFFDADAGLYLALARAYDPSLGRFLQRDPQHRIPFGSQKDLSPYTYCGSDPVNFTDRDGIQPTQANDPFLDRVRERFQKEVQGFASFMPKPGEFQLSDPASWINYGNWAGLNRSPADRNTPVFDPADIGPKAHDLAFRDTGLKFNDFTNPAVGRIHGQLGLDLRAAELNPDTTIAGHIFTHLAAPVFEAFSVIPEAASAYHSLTSLFQISNDQKGTSGDRLSVPLLRDDNRFIPPFPPGGGGGGAANVGGVALRGAGDALKGLGQLRGMALDAQGRLVLITDQQGTAGQVALPSLRLDDVVTIFRCVYDRGEAPFVSIDPDPKNPEGPTMNTRHDPGTVRNYVGWVLFEADRVMKVYTLGVDNDTKLPVNSRIKDYQNIPNRMLGLREAVVQGQWQRYWIKVDEVTFRTDRSGHVTLADVKLRLDTETMVLDRNGELVPAPNAQPPKSSVAFAEWFTRNYKQIDAERKSRTPGKTAAERRDVAVFQELERMALIAALAERLRDQGVPMPGWMRDYRVKPFDTPTTTPTVYGSDVTRRIRVFGGAVLGGGKVTVKEDDPKANALAAVVLDAADRAPFATTVGIVTPDRQKLNVAALPGANSRAFGGNQLAETDLAVPFAGGELRLTRRFNSFVGTRDVYGAAWTLDLPRLEKQRWPTRREGGRTEFTIGYRLATPLGSLSESFRDIKPVDTPQVRGNIAVPVSADSPIIGIANARPDDVAGAKHAMYFRNGQVWSFDDAGRLLAVKDGTTVVRYEYADGRLASLQGLSRNEVLAEIKLEYANGLVSAAKAGDRTVKYVYDQEGKLVEVAGDDGTAGYAYTMDDGKKDADAPLKPWLVQAVKWNGVTVREFGYTTGGRLARVKDAGGEESKVEVTNATGETTVKVGGTSTTYDAAQRPLSQIAADGTTTAWERTKPDTVKVTVTPGGDAALRCTVTRTGDTATLKLPDGVEYTATFDQGRLTEVNRSGKAVLRQKFDRNGRLLASADDTTVLEQRYARNVLAERTLRSAAGGDEWLKVEFDANGRPETVTGSDGLDLAFAYDASGRLQKIKRNGETLDWERDRNGRTTGLTTSWGEKRKTTFAPIGNRVARTEVSRGEKTATVEYERGRPIRAIGFDGQAGTVAYHDVGPQKDRVKEVKTPDGLLLKYAYSADGRKVTVTCDGAWKLEYTFDARGRLVERAQVPLSK